MGIIVCQSCEKTIEHFEGEKVSTLYAKSTECENCKHETVGNNR
ncbi:GapA-binding peptide SR1P [Desertibacillus haloalkaliphilus]|nr:GapA-binding peptide SR1P [Desertibacillus haloalkaliphilus]MBU8906743.1 GapA-binding peptide SR1P [Desertibacillus haloalkaliphilus]